MKGTTIPKEKYGAVGTKLAIKYDPAQFSRTVDASGCFRGVRQGETSTNTLKD